MTVSAQLPFTLCPSAPPEPASPPPPPPPSPPGGRFDHTPGHDHHKHVPKAERSSSNDLLLRAHSNLAVENGFGPDGTGRESRGDSIEGGPLDPLGLQRLSSRFISSAT